MKRVPTHIARLPRAVLFDMDGVIVDSMPYHFIAWYEALRSIDIKVSLQDVFLKEGERWDRTLSTLLRKHRVHPDTRLLRKLFERRKKAFRRVFARFIFPGCAELLACLSGKGYKLGLVTGTPEVEVRAILPARILRLFHTLVTGNMIKQGKPHPEPYLLAAKRLHVSAVDCVVIENAPLGITAAKRAGMACIALSTSLPASFLKRADIVVSRYEEISALIDASCKLPPLPARRNTR
jgi:beta-phosphoglucomutase